MFINKGCYHGTADWGDAVPTILLEGWKENLHCFHCKASNSSWCCFCNHLELHMELLLEHLYSLGTYHLCPIQNCFLQWSCPEGVFASTWKKSSCALGGRGNVPQASAGGWPRILSHQTIKTILFHPDAPQFLQGSQQWVSERDQFTRPQVDCRSKSKSHGYTESPIKGTSDKGRW